MNCTFGPRARGWGPSCAVSALQRMSIVGHAQGSTRTETAYRYDRRSHSRWPDRHRRSRRYPTVSTQQSGISSKRISTDGQGSERPPKLFSGNLEKLREATTRDRTVARSHGRLSSKIMIFGQTVPDIMNWKLWVPFQILPARWFLHLLGARRSIVRPTAKVRQL